MRNRIPSEKELPPAFQGLSREELNEVFSAGITKDYPAGQMIVLQGEDWPYLFLVDEGEIEVVKESAEGRMFIAANILPGNLFWGIAFFREGAPSPVILQTKGPTRLMLWSRQRLLPTIQQSPVLAWNFCQIMVHRMLMASEIVEDLAFQPVMSRLAGLMLNVFGGAEDEYVARSLTLDDMAARIGTTREMVCRHLYKFAETGAIEITRTELKINDREFLENQAARGKHPEHD